MTWEEDPIGPFIDEVVAKEGYPETLVCLGRLADHLDNLSVLKEIKVNFMPAITVEDETPDLEEFYTCIYFIEKGDFTFEEWKSFILNDLEVFYIRLYSKEKAVEAFWVGEG